MSNNGNGTLQQMTKLWPDVSPRIIQAIKLGMVIASGGALSMLDIADMLNYTDRQARRISDLLVRETKGDGDLAVTNDRGFLRLISLQK